ncbi:MAG: hypothetical protein IT534_05010 [Bauldia sp.]|nr:hypothetical protein [Bauldia sp.]
MTRQNISYGTAALLLIGTSVAALAQAPAPATDAQVTADTATHTAMLAGSGEGTGWFLVDEQNNSIRWHIEFTGAEPTGAAIMCPPAEGAAPPAADAAAPTVALTGAIVGAGAEAPAGMPADAAGLVEVLNLLEEGGTLTSPFEGQTADLEDGVFAQIVAGACFLDLTTAATGGAAPMTPATPMTPPANP